MLQGFGDFNFALSLAAVGSAIGTGVAGMAAIGAWKKAMKNNQQPTLKLLIFVGAPLTQTFYGFILSLLIRGKAYQADMETYKMLMIFGALAGLAMGASAMFQGKAAACACDAFVECDEKGTPNFLMTLGVVEAVALFVMIFFIIALPTV